VAFQSESVMTISQTAPTFAPERGQNSVAAPRELRGLIDRVARDFGLTERERQVLAAASEGRCMKRIANDLGITDKAVQYFWVRIYEKAGCTSQIEVMALLLRYACAGPT
jgi:DNA-binding NarL/FixJ family response regulator